MRLQHPVDFSPVVIASLRLVPQGHDSIAEKHVGKLSDTLLRTLCLNKGRALLSLSAHSEWKGAWEQEQQIACWFFFRFLGFPLLQLQSWLQRVRQQSAGFYGCSPYTYATIVRLLPLCYYCTVYSVLCGLPLPVVLYRGSGVLWGLCHSGWSIGLDLAI